MTKRGMKKSVCFLAAVLAALLLLAPTVSLAGNAPDLPSAPLSTPQPQETQLTQTQDDTQQKGASEETVTQEERDEAPCESPTAAAGALTAGRSPEGENLLGNSSSAGSPQRIADLFPDAVFADHIRMKLGKASVNDTVTQSELSSITELYLPTTVAELTGVGNLPNLELLQLYGRPGLTIPAEIGSLSKLRKLVLQTNELTSLPPEIGNLTSLEELDLIGNHFESIPSVVLGLTGLRKLLLSNNGLKEIPAEIGNMTALQSLVLANNEITAIPEEIERLQSLEVLTLGDNLISSVPEAYGNLSSLQGVNLENNLLVSVPDAITRPAGLTYISLYGNQLESLPAGIGKLQKLNQLMVYDNNLTSLPEEICDCPALSVIHAGQNRLTSLPAGIGKLTKLYSLNVADNDITELPYVIGSFRELRALNADRNRLTALPPTIALLPKCYELTVSGNDLTSLPEEIAYMPKLDYLDVSGNHLTDVSVVPDTVRDFDATDQYVTLEIYRSNITLPTTYSPPDGSVVLWDRGYEANEMVSNSFYSGGAFHMKSNPQSGRLESKSGEFSVNYTISLRDSLIVDIGTQEINLREGEFYTLRPTSDVLDGYQAEFTCAVTEGADVARFVPPDMVIALKPGRAYLTVRGEVKGTGVTGEVTVPVNVIAPQPNLQGTEYPLLDGDGKTADRGTAALEFRFDAPFDQFENAWLDDELLERGVDYTPREGSTIIKLHKSLLSRLENGTHTLTVGFTDGYARATFEVNHDVSLKKAPKTGDEAPIDLLVTGAACSAAILAAVFVRKRRTGSTKAG